ncbi:MAG: AAA family ATPase [Euryarchaeota archaeon]|nr:AAA family ATPase [Euryarchaeota archaeon]
MGGVIIAISGPAGSGKTTVAKTIAEKFKLQYVSAGEIFRQMASGQNLSLLKFSELAENEPNIDREIDRRQIELAKKGNVVLEGRLSGWMVRDIAHLRVCLKAPLEVRAKRIAQREKRSYEEVLNETKIRDKSEAKRYKEIYGVEVDNLNIYDLVIDTVRWNSNQIAEILSVPIKFAIERTLPE